MPYVDLIQDLAGRSEWFNEHCRLVGDRIGNQMQVFQRQRQVFREGAIVSDDAQHFSSLAMASQSAPTKLADRGKSKRAAGDVNFSGDPFAHPTFLDDRGNASYFFNFTQKFMPRGSVKIVVAAQNLDVGIAYAGYPH